MGRSGFGLVDSAQGRQDDHLVFGSAQKGCLCFEKKNSAGQPPLDSSDKGLPRKKCSFLRARSHFANSSGESWRSCLNVFGGKPFGLMAASAGCGSGRSRGGFPPKKRKSRQTRNKKGRAKKRSLESLGFERACFLGFRDIRPKDYLTKGDLSNSLTLQTRAHVLTSAL